MKSPSYPDRNSGTLDTLPASDVSAGKHGDRRFSERLVASDHATRAVLAAIDGWLSAHGVEADDRANAELILAEALNNICEHAYRGGGGPVELVIDMRSQGLDCVLRDRGHSLPGATLPGRDPPPIDPPDNLPDGGFGWHIIRCLASDICYRRAAGWNRLSFRVVFAGFE